MIDSTAKYFAEDWAEGKTNDEIKAEIAYINSLWEIKHPNPFPKNAHYSYSRMETLKNILANR
jgi:hypothetical protein